MKKGQRALEKRCAELVSMVEQVAEDDEKHRRAKEMLAEEHKRKCEVVQEKRAKASTVAFAGTSRGKSDASPDSSDEDESSSVILV